MTLQATPELALSLVRQGRHLAPAELAAVLPVDAPIAELAPVAPLDAPIAELAISATTELALPAPYTFRPAAAAAIVSANTESIDDADAANKRSNGMYAQYSRWRQELTGRIQSLSTSVDTNIGQQQDLVEHNVMLREDTAQAEQDRLEFEQSLQQKRQQQAELEVELAAAQARAEEFKRKEGSLSEHEINDILMGHENGTWTNPAFDLAGVRKNLMDVMDEIASLEGRQIPNRVERIDTNHARVAANDARLSELAQQLHWLQGESQRLSKLQVRALDWFTIAQKAMEGMAGEIRSELQRGEIGHDADS